MRSLKTDSEQLAKQHDTHRDVFLLCLLTKCRTSMNTVWFVKTKVLVLLLKSCFFFPLNDLSAWRRPLCSHGITLVAESTGAPLCSSSSTKSLCPSLAAKCNALSPFWKNQTNTVHLASSIQTKIAETLINVQTFKNNIQLFENF